MKRTLRYTLATLALAAAAVTGATLTDTAPPDTAWGAADTTPDPAPTTPPADGDGSVTPFDTAWG